MSLPVLPDDYTDYVQLDLPEQESLQLYYMVLGINADSSGSTDWTSVEKLRAAIADYMTSAGDVLVRAAITAATKDFAGNAGAVVPSVADAKAAAKEFNKNLTMAERKLALAICLGYMMEEW